MFRRVSTSFILLSWILTVYLSSVVRGQVRVVGPSETVTAHVGDAVVLPCRSDPPVDLIPLTVEWSRTELRPNPSDPQKRVEYVHLYINYHDDDLDMKIAEFTNRTQLFPDQLAAGVASLHIQNVGLSDNGTYKCFITNLPTNKTLRFTHVTLVVEAATAPTQAPDLDHKQEDSDRAGDSNASTVRTIWLKMGIFCIFAAVFFVAVILFQRKAPEKQPEERDDSTQESLQNESTNSVAVRVEDVNLLIHPQA